MGQKKTKNQRFLERNPICIFCGGTQPAEDEDHVPPRTLFWDRKWPEGYSFGACRKCNNSSSNDDYIVGLLAKMGPQSLNIDRKRQLQVLINKLTHKKRALAIQMLNMSASEKKRKAKEIGLAPGSNGTYHDAPLLFLPKEFEAGMKTFATKLTKALHYKHTGTVVPADAGIRFYWETNVNLLEGKSIANSDYLGNLIECPPLVRESVRLNDQFNYRFRISDDGKIGIYFCHFGNSMAFLTFIAFDKNILMEVTANIEKVDPSKINAMQELQ